MRIGILQPGHAADAFREKTGDFAEMFERLLGETAFEYAVFDVEAGEFPSGPEAADGWLITGSRHGVYEDHDWLAPLEALIREIVASGRPLVGICFGHQVIAQALGGEVGKFDGGWVVGRQVYRLDGADVALNAWHQDQVLTPPDGAVTLASNDFCAHAALAIGDNVLTFQPHPEFGRDVVQGLIDHRSAGVAPELLDGARAGLGQPVDNAEIGARLAAFLKAGAA